VEARRVVRLPLATDEVQQRAEALGRQEQLGVVLRPALGEDGEEAPVVDAGLAQHLADAGQLGQVARVGAGDDVEERDA
jgi:hypothetical protein